MAGRYPVDCGRGGGAALPSQPDHDGREPQRRGELRPRAHHRGGAQDCGEDAGRGAPNDGAQDEVHVTCAPGSFLSLLAFHSPN